MATRHLSVVRGSIRHDVVVDPTLSVGEVVTDVLGDVLPDVFGVLPPGGRWFAVSLMGEVLVASDSVERAGLEDGAVIVVAAPATLPPANCAGGSRGIRGVGIRGVEGTRSGRQERRDRSGERAPTDGVVTRVAGYCGLVLFLVAAVVVSVRTTGMPPLSAAVLALAIAAAMSLVVPDLVLRVSCPAPATTTAGPATVMGWGGSPDMTSVQRWVRVVARRQVGAHLAVLVVVLVASGVALLAVMAPTALAATVGSSVSTRVSGPALVSVCVSVMVLAGSTRGRGRTDRWILRVASMAAVLPALLGLAGSMSTPAAMAAASTCAVVGLAALAPVCRRRPPKLRRSRLASGVDVAVAVAALPLACWAAGLLSGVQAWADGRM